ncbi:MAG: hypothetical protein RL398_1800 [Planctomycetota bacterium]
MPSLQRLPNLGTADEDVLFVEWMVAAGDRIRAGQTIATIETLKAAFDVEADADGVLLRTLCEPGQRIAARAPIGVVGDPGDPCGDDVVAALAATATHEPPSGPAVPTISPQPFCNASGTAPVAPAARARAAELGLDLAAVVGSGPDGLIRVVDVERTAAARHADAAGDVDPAFVALLRADEAAFANLSSDAKVHLYRKHGALIGDGCRLARGALLVAERIVLGDGASFGRDTVVQAKELRSGALLHFGARCRARATALRFGDNAFFADDVEIGGGGAMDPEALLDVGSHGFVGEHVHLNPCRTLRIGDEVVISRQATVMTHSFGPSFLRGYPSRFADVEIGDGAQIGIAAVLFPGIRIGAGAIVLSGSSVVTDVPAGRLYAGVPAPDQKAAAQSLRADELQARAAGLVREFARQLRLRDRHVELDERSDAIVLTTTERGAAHRLEFRASGGFGAGEPAAELVHVAVAFPPNEFETSAPNVTAIALESPRVRGPLGPLAAAFREFLRKRGVRLHPRSWTYPGGWL